MFAAVAAMMAACSTEELSNVQGNQQSAEESAVTFSFYTPRSVTRAGLAGNELATPEYGVTTTSITTGRHKDAGIGMFGFFTNNGEYDTNNSIPNFMYNQQVLYTTSPKFTGTNWTYEPVKYWPNEYGNAAASDDVDHLTFFCYAPYVDVNVTSGTPIVKDDFANLTADEKNLGAQKLGYADYATAQAALVTDAEIYAAYVQQEQKTNITQLSRNTATGDPIVKYVVDTNPSTSVDLLWGVSADNSYSDMGATAWSKVGYPYVDVTKQGNVSGNLKWTMKHALAMLNVQIIMAVDDKTASHYNPTATPNNPIGTEGDGTTDAKTKVYVRSVTFENGFAMQGALNLHSEETGAAGVDGAVPNWKDYDGSKELSFDDAVTFYDGLKDGKEGTTNNIQKNEKPIGLNPALIEEATDMSLATPWESKKAGVPTNAFVNLFAGAQKATDPIYVIPSGEDMNVVIEYDIQTQDEKLAGVLSDAVHHGSAISNKIYKENVFGANIEPGKMYTLKIILGVESVKFEVVVTDWANGVTDAETELPENI